MELTSFVSVSDMAAVLVTFRGGATDASTVMRPATSIAGMFVNCSREVIGPEPLAAQHEGKVCLHLGSVR